jgi:uncharacterized low-complexity protein
VVGPVFPQDFRAVISSLEQRLLVLAAAAFLGGAATLAVVAQREPESAPASFASAPAPTGWNRAFAGSRGAVGDAQRTTCGHVLTARSRGVTHPVLPCGAKLVLRHGDVQLLTEVIDNNLVEPGRQLEVTEELARMLGLDGTEEIDWRFATESSG